jgi:pimeloyl-ACP methyl ester carboxylesterase
MTRTVVLCALLFCFCHHSTSARAEEHKIVRIQQVAPQSERPCAADARKRDAIFFLHGLFGSNETWRPTTWWFWPGTSFPELIVSDSALNCYDVYTIEYDSFLVSSSPDVTAITNMLELELRPYVGPDSKYRNIIFISHSLGGNLFRNYLLRLKVVNPLGAHEIMSKFRIAIFLGTPFTGAGMASGAGLVLPNPQVGSLVDVGNDYLQLLNATSIAIDEKHFTWRCPSMRFYSAYEKRPTYGKLIVPQSAATVNTYACKGFDDDHLTLAKPSDANAEIYKSVRDLLVGCHADDFRFCGASEPCLPVQPAAVAPAGDRACIRGWNP